MTVEAGELPLVGDRGSARQPLLERGDDEGIRVDLFEGFLDGPGGYRRRDAGLRQSLLYTQRPSPANPGLVCAIAPATRASSMLLFSWSRSIAAPIESRSWPRRDSR